MTETLEIHPKWNSYRALVDETSELEYKIIEILSGAVSRKEGNGKPSLEEAAEINKLKAILHPKLNELKTLHVELADYIEEQKIRNVSRYLK